MTKISNPSKLSGRPLWRGGLITAAVGALVVAGFIAAPAGAWADTNALTDNQVTASDVQQTLAKADSKDLGLVATPVTSQQTNTNAAVATTALGSTISVPKDPSDGVGIITPGGATITINLPNADNASDAAKLPDGTVAYASKDASASAVIPTDTGVQVLTTIANSTAPTRYDYPLDLPLGAKVEVVEDGGAQVVDGSGNILSVITPAWARDTNGIDVPTHYETDGRTLTQVINHSTTKDVAYPVVADPQWWQWGISAAVGAAVGIAVAAILKVPQIGWILGGCVSGAMNAMFDGRSFWGVATGCLQSALWNLATGPFKALGWSYLQGKIASFMASRGFRI